MVQPTLDVRWFNPLATPHARFAARSLADQAYTCSEDWVTTEPLAIAVDLLKAQGGEVRSSSCAHGIDLVEVVGDTWAVLIQAGPRAWEASATSTAGHDSARRLIDALAILAGPPPAPTSGSIPLTVWSENLVSGGGSRRWSEARVGAWSAVADNYPGEIRDQLAALAAGIPSIDQGGLVVFCGAAGTGKTRATEALIHAWASQGAEVSLVVDPDRLLASATYLADVISAASDKRHVVIVEDGDAMMAAGPKQASVQKLLNVADGLLGRCAGSEGTLWVLTANLAAVKIAPYLTRPGRAAAVVEFRAFDPAEATTWAGARGIDGDFDQSATLAELYAALR